MNMAQAPSDRAGRTGRLIVVGWTFLLVAAVLWPFAFPGMPLLRDMVVPPYPALTDDAWGLGESAARAVPQDTLLALAGAFTDAGLVMRVLMFVGLAVGGLATAELVRRALGAGIVGQITAVTMVLWNPFVVERLLQGQWSLVLAMAMLPAVAAATVAAAPWWRATAMAVAGLTPTGALLGWATAVVAARTWRDRAVATLTALIVSAPWLVATALGSGAAVADPAGAGAFAARAERWVGTLGALAGLGGIWNSQAVPDARETGPAALAVVALLALFVVGARMAWGRKTGAVGNVGNPRTTGASGITGVTATVGVRRRLIVLAAAAVLVPALLATGPGLSVMAWALETIPGAGLARDAQKWVALAVPGYAFLAAAGAESIARLLPPPRRWLAGSFAVVVVIAAVPDLPRAIAPLTPTTPWSGWSVVSGIVAMDDSAVAVLPAGTYRIIEGRPVYDPAVKTLPAPVLGTGELVVSGVAVDGEGSTAADVEATLLDAPDDAVATLRANGVGWVLVEDSPGEMGDSHRVLDRLEVVYADEHLTLHRVPGAIAPVDRADRTPAWIAFFAWAAMLAAGPVRGLVGGTSPGGRPGTSPGNGNRATGAGIRNGGRRERRRREARPRPHAPSPPN
ncbi:hypothetical protein [uncultured Corynebacterium sp.]|uniref:hypothetical protein n=1 Tax=uncultured Corynebacterium sp. TaxID=159447 RepID=UPI0025DC748D|nr:hypothetical protein [uncultured Corynebacterium sp.]